jgi:hypothetical protein
MCVLVPVWSRPEVLILAPQVEPSCAGRRRDGPLRRSSKRVRGAFLLNLFSSLPLTLFFSDRLRFFRAASSCRALLPLLPPPPTRIQTRSTSSPRASCRPVRDSRCVQHRRDRTTRRDPAGRASRARPTSSHWPARARRTTRSPRPCSRQIIPSSPSSVRRCRLWDTCPRCSLRSSRSFRAYRSRARLVISHGPRDARATYGRPICAAQVAPCA